MHGSLDDTQTEQIVLQHGLLSPEDLEQYKAQSAADPNSSLFDLLVGQGILHHDHLVGAQPQASGSGRLAGGSTLRRRRPVGIETDAGLPGASPPEGAGTPSPMPDPAAAPAPVLGGEPAQPVIGPGRSTIQKSSPFKRKSAKLQVPMQPQGADPAGPEAGAAAPTSPPQPSAGAPAPTPQPQPAGSTAAKSPFARPANGGAAPHPTRDSHPSGAKLRNPFAQSAGGAQPPAQPPGGAAPKRPFARSAPGQAAGAPAGAPPQALQQPPQQPGQLPPLQPAPVAPLQPQMPQAMPGQLQQPQPQAFQPQPMQQPQPAPQPPAEAHGKDESDDDEAPEGWPGGVAPEDPTPDGIQAYLKEARQAGASDLHLSVGLPPMIRVHGGLSPLREGHPPCEPAFTERLIRMLLTPEQWAYFDRTGDLDCCYSFESGGRFRTNILQQRNGLDMACRIIGERIYTLEELGLPTQARRLTEFAQGLVLITGPSGHGKTTTMMSLVEMVNQTRPDHIITVEDPIEFVLEGSKCQVTQREVGPHTASFATALRAALREDPDIIVIGELRDYDTTSMAINAAETGHLVFASLPTQDATKTIDKVIDIFPPEEQEQIRLMVSESLRGVVSQQLIPRKDGAGRVAAVELLFNSVGVANIIRDANTPGLVNAMQLGKNLGMIIMDEALEELVKKELIAGEEAWLRASNKQKFQRWAPRKG